MFLCFKQVSYNTLSVKIVFTVGPDHLIGSFHLSGLAQQASPKFIMFIIKDLES